MLKGRAKVPIPATAVLTASCLDHDNPLAVDAPAGVDPAETDEPPAMARSGQSAIPPPIVDNFRERFRLDFSVAGGALVPNSPIAVTLYGVANEPLTGGAVEVTLPTIAAMTQAGDGKRPSYPMSRKLPVAATWRLPAMNAGDNWSRTVQIGGVENGYYQIAAHITTTGATGTESPYVLDDAHREAWLLVTQPPATSASTQTEPGHPDHEDIRGTWLQKVGV